jgi:hypothetical protein
MMKKILLLSILNINYRAEDEKKCPVAWSDNQKTIMMVISVVWGLSELSKLAVNVKKLWCKDKSCKV